MDMSAHKGRNTPRQHIQGGIAIHTLILASPTRWQTKGYHPRSRSSNQHLEQGNDMQTSMLPDQARTVDHGFSHAYKTTVMSAGIVAIHHSTGQLTQNKPTKGENARREDAMASLPITTTPPSR